MDQEQQSRWPPTRRQLLWASAAVALLTIAIIVGYRYDITLWDWAKLLIVPAVIAAGGLWFNAQQRDREQLIAEHRTQDDTLQAYLDGMSQLLTDRDRPLHSAQPGDSLSIVARARTLTVLERLDSARKRSVLQFLYEARLIDQEQALLDAVSYLIERRHNIVSLQHADLSGADLYNADLSRADLRFADLHGTNLHRANLYRANLERAYLSGADLRRAFLSRADLRIADLSEADLSGANLRWTNLLWADLSGADLSEADLMEAYLRGTNLSGANLSDASLMEADLINAKLIGADLRSAFLRSAFLYDADLSDADLSDADLSDADLSDADLSDAEGVTNKELEQQAKSLKGATMPNGQKYEDWLKDRE